MKSDRIRRHRRDAIANKVPESRDEACGSKSLIPSCYSEAARMRRRDAQEEHSNSTTRKGCDCRSEQVPESRDEACGSKSLIPMPQSMPHQKGSSAGLINVRGGGKP